MRLLSLILSIALQAQPVALALPDYDTNGPGIPIFIESIYDADTLTVLLRPSPLNQSWQREKIRLFNVADGTGVNAPEVRGIQKLQGLISKLWVQEQLGLSPEERLVTQGDRGKYGRLLGDISYRCHPIAHPKDWCSLAKRLVDSGMAIEKEY